MQQYTLPGRGRHRIFYGLWKHVDHDMVCKESMLISSDLSRFKVLRSADDIINIGCYTCNIKAGKCKHITNRLDLSQILPSVMHLASQAGRGKYRQRNRNIVIVI